MSHNWIQYYDIDYIRGLIEYPSSSSCRIFLYNERLELDWDKGQDEPSMVIPYKSMTNIENLDDQKISALRVIGFGVIGALWKQQHRYTAIQYKDETGEKNIVLDFGKYIEEAQPLIYQKMIDAKRTKGIM